ncbi:hypothetical protein D3C78_1250580 [compost metagenome]
MSRALQGVRRRRSSIEHMNPLLEEGRRIIIGLRLNILRQRQRHRPRLSRIGQHPHRVQGGAHKLLRPNNPVPELADRAECIHCRNGIIARHLKLLQHRIGLSAGEVVSRQQQHRNTVDRRGSGSRHHIKGSRPYGGCTSINLLAAALLCECSCCMHHALLVFALNESKAARASLQRFT